MVMPALPVDQARQAGWTSRPGTVVLGVASSIILEANPYRKEAIIINASDTTVFLTKGELSAVNSGWTLWPGGSAIIVPDNSGRVYVGPVSGICTLAAKRVTFTEDW